MTAAWWFDPRRVAGMARPGFNACHWYDLSHEEAALLTWLGSGAASGRDLADFLTEYVRLREPALGAGAATVRARLLTLGHRPTFERALSAVCARTGSYVPNGGEPVLNAERVQHELAALSDSGFTAIVSLLEQPLDPTVRAGPIEVVHLPTPDMLPPRDQDVRRVADLISNHDKGRIAVHCLAGMGRTTTMLMAAHMMLGHPLSAVRMRVEKQNPRYRFAGPQWHYLQSLAERLKLDDVSDV